jgi:hypothetical protein
MLAKTLQLGSMIVSQLDTVAVSFESLRREAGAKGMNKLGNGVFGVVYDHPNDKRLVIKIGRETARHSVSEKGIEVGAWGHWTITSQSYLNAAFRPVVLKLDTFRNGNDLCYVAIMEKLIPCRDKQQADSLSKLILSNSSGIFDFGIKVEHGEFNNATSPDALKLCQTLQHVMKKNNNDLHSGNIMARKVGNKLVPIITDPVT